MGTAIVLVLGVLAWIAAVRGQKRRQLMLAAASATARLRHLREAEFPSSCTWCKNTTLARKLILFEFSRDGWKANDVLSRLTTCSDDAVENLATVLTTDQPRWRRICTERCAREFFAAEHVAVVEAFTSCAYCSARSPAALSRCSNCGAARVSG